MKNEYKEILLTEIIADPDQPRKVFDEEKLQELADSISAIGVKQAITVRIKEDGTYMIIAGERRFRASKMANKETIPAIVVQKGSELTEESIYAHQLTENLHREDLNPVERAEFINNRINELKLLDIQNANQQVANELGVSKSWVSKALQPLKVGEDLRKLAQKGKVRDYTILKKVDKLRGEKRQSALDQINKGEFNSIDFFKKKRKQKEKSVDDTQNQESKEKMVNIKLTISEFVSLISKTDFKHSFSNLSSDEKNLLLNEKPNQLVKQFVDWVKIS